jgi:NSS family neurotransmitter:Na+ symporter
MFLLAAAGFVVGLNSIWQFPHHLALHGGSAFLLMYVVFLALLGLPLLMAQLMLGRLARAAPATGIAVLARRYRAPRPWRRLGALATVGGFLVLCYYNVVAGWLLAYLLRAASGTLSGITAEGAASVFTALVREPERQLFWHGLFVVMTLTVVGSGLRAGIERVLRYTVPVVVLLMLLLIGYAAGTGSFTLGLEYFLRLDFTQLGSDGVLVALGDAFFSLGLGVATFMLYGAYLPGEAPLLRMSMFIILIDLGAGILAGFAVFPVLFAGGSLSTYGPELVFQALAVAFDPLPLGALMRTLLFLMLVLIAWTSTIGLVEPVVAWLVERRGLSRIRAALWTGLATWLVGVVAILSLHDWAFGFSLFGIARTLGFFDVLVSFTTLVLLPLAGVSVALFAGWIVRPETSMAALAIQSPCLHDAWLWLNRLVIPALFVLMLFGLHLFL